MRRLQELLRLAGESVLAIWPDDVDWVAIYPGIGRVEMVDGPFLPEDEREALFVRPGRLPDKPSGLRLWAGYDWAIEALLARPGYLPSPTKQVPRKNGYAMRRRSSWKERVCVDCLGQKHEVTFSRMGARSDVHSPEELLFLEGIGEGCGKVLSAWRGGHLGFFAEEAKRRHLRDVRVERKLSWRWEEAVKGILAEELAVSGLPFAYAWAAGGWHLVTPHASYFLGVRGPGSWYQEVYKVGLRAMPGWFPVFAHGGVRWLEKGS